ncbi:unnamed protein product [Ceratitis capitata]|uniref:(Mediterranean fruit fly) hypothetical protein n=1 Tax=Ceratitis capitata TaxID=7213 RepID=A0A811UMU2_CERCA|nr:unnamed protein product [Ceratitis capitata]
MPTHPSACADACTSRPPSLLLNNNDIWPRRQRKRKDTPTSNHRGMCINNNQTQTAITITRDVNLVEDKANQFDYNEDFLVHCAAKVTQICGYVVIDIL